MTNPVAYVDAATMMRGVGAGMPIKAVGVTLQQSPMAFIYRADAARPTKIEEIKGSRIAITAGDASLAIFTAFMGKLGMKLDDVKLITVANPQSKEQAVLNKQADALLGYFMDQGPRMQLQTGVKMGWTRLYDMAGISTLSSAIIVNNDWLKDAKNQDHASALPARLAARLAIHLRQSRRGRRDLPEARAGLQQGDRAARDRRHHDDPAHQEYRRQADRLVGDRGLEGHQELLEKFAKLKPQADLNVYYTNEYLSEPPYLPKK